MEKAIIDTNVIIYDYVEDSEYHKKAEELLDSLNKWIIPAIVIHELVWFLKDMKLEDKINDVFAYVRNEKAEVICDSVNNIVDSLEILIREKLPLADYKDMIILSHAIREKLPLVTFDKKLSKIAKKYGVSVVS
ncbi:PIN domain-containing protein [Sulfurisphaera tokodaii]|uniref:Toxin n=2 Tax=Sulfurisphaera tokodaii TaxID=111955 RepID=Q973Q8_SULTO|nr:PIN domain-containing protein [Sulfurisphaera tokodaii]BAB65852.1 putative toxin [Sulfurisphaera tokodaii str. 7]HII74412.1 PIN domain-containing protein [Sulfurisphaera tokodaii]